MTAGPAKRPPRAVLSSSPMRSDSSPIDPGEPPAAANRSARKSCASAGASNAGRGNVPAAPSGPAPRGAVDLRKLRQLVEMVRGSCIAELEFRDGSSRIRVTNARDAGARPSPAAPPAATGQAGIAAAPAKPPAPAPHVVKSPGVGTLHRARVPGGPPCVAIGDVVEAGRTLCVIEAMKLASEVHADRAGTVTAALVEEGQPVEYGQPLFVIA